MQISSNVFGLRSFSCRGKYMITQTILQVLRDAAVRGGEEARVDAHLWPGSSARLCGRLRG